MWEWIVSEGCKPLGYRYLVEFYELGVLPHHRWTFVGTKWEKETIEENSYSPTVYILPPSTKIEENPLSNLIFALKHEGVNLLIIKEVLQRIPEEELLGYVKSNQKNKYARLMWFFFENFFNRRLDIPDLASGNYIPVLNPREYYTCKPIRSQRHRVHNNLLGSFSFCPVIRKTEKLEKLLKEDYSDQLNELIKRFSPETLARASQYLFTKETLASWEIEREKPNHARIAKFTSLLSRLPHRGNLNKEVLVKLQKEIVDERFALNDYREFQNYVGEEPIIGKMILHYISPRPEDLSSLMEGLLQSFSIMMQSKMHPILIAATLSFGFVFMHPFWDGNGRLHRYLIHYVLHLCDFSPDNFLFPVSAAILRDEAAYDNILEQFSQPVLEIIKGYTISSAGEMKVTQNTKSFYQYLDFTRFAQYLCHCIEQTISTEFEEELLFLEQYDLLKKAMNEFISMPDHLIDLFLKCLQQNGGKLSQRKREKCFSMLSRDEIENLERIYQDLRS